MSFGAEYGLNPHTVISGRYVRNKLTRTIEDIGRLVNGSEAYTLGNPGEGRFVNQTNHYGATPDFPMPKPLRQYDAMELSINRRFSNNWFLAGNYTFSRLYGNYSGLSNTDEVATSNGGSVTGGWSTSQSPSDITGNDGQSIAGQAATPTGIGMLTTSCSTLMATSSTGACTRTDPMSSSCMGPTLLVGERKWAAASV